MSASNQPASLLCSLCPKQPRFSDISHLLTHISSKSHLSHHFKLQIRSQSDAEAKKKLDDFDRWYRGNGFDIRLSERLALKEQKKAAAKKICPSSNIKVVKKYTPVEDIKPSLERITPVPQIHLWPTTTTGPPIPCSHFGAQPMREIPTRATAPLYNYWDCTIAKEEAPTDTSILYEDNLTEDEYPEVNPKLKGDNVWPGMNLFDSATEEMRRLRNQRKDGSFVERMMANSTEIEALECVYDAGGEFVDARDIFALPSTENSPIKKRVLTPKRLRPRRALGDIDKNIPRTSNAEPSKVDPEQPATNLPSGLSGARSYVPTSDEDEEFKMTVGEIMNNKRSFNIFQDSPDKTHPQDPFQDQSSEFCHDGLPAYLAKQDETSTPYIKQDIMLSADKENDIPQFGMLGNVSKIGFSAPRSPFDMHFNPFCYRPQPYPHSYIFNDYANYDDMINDSLNLSPPKVAKTPTTGTRESSRHKQPSSTTNFRKGRGGLRKHKK